MSLFFHHFSTLFVFPFFYETREKKEKKVQTSRYLYKIVSEIERKRAREKEKLFLVLSFLSLSLSLSVWHPPEAVDTRERTVIKRIFAYLRDTLYIIAFLTTLDTVALSINIIVRSDRKCICFHSVGLSICLCQHQQRLPLELQQLY